ncbi:MAG: tRNA-dihydrouridine synthase [Candidatus Nealsonbacteria bacterium]
MLQSNFWKKLKRPIMTIAPMSDITGAAFRRMLLKFGRPDVFWTEFVSVDGLFSRGRENVLKDLKFSPKEHPIVAQVFGAKPDLFEKTAMLIKSLGFDGIDINMGCPNRDVEKRGAGAALIKNPDLAQQIIRATKRGAGNLPVSVKTRIGYAKNEITEWIPALLKENLAVLTVHFRTRNESYNTPAQWELAQRIVKFRDHYSPETLIFGNGDIKSLAQARQMAKRTELDGIMIGRGVLLNPWFFSERTPDLKERIRVIIEHAKISEKLHKDFHGMNKYFKAYAAGFNGARDLRDCLMKTKNVSEVKQITKKFLESR